MANAAFAGTNLVFGGTRSGTYWLRASPDITMPLNAWPVVATNIFDSNGGSGITSPINPTTNQLFFLLQSQ